LRCCDAYRPATAAGPAPLRVCLSQSCAIGSLSNSIWGILIWRKHVRSCWIPMFSHACTAYSAVLGCLTLATYKMPYTSGKRSALQNPASDEQAHPPGHGGQPKDLRWRAEPPEGSNSHSYTTSRLSNSEGAKGNCAFRSLPVHSRCRVNSGVNPALAGGDWLSFLPGSWPGQPPQNAFRVRCPTLADISGPIRSSMNESPA
jgi:hypothetical protein